MTATLEFIFDFGSPNAYLAHRALGPVLQRTGAQVGYTPCLLGGIFKATGNQAPMMAFANVPNKLAYIQVEMQRFIKNHEITAFQFNPHFPVNTLTLMRGAVAVEEEGRLADYIEAGLKAMWEDGLKMDDPGVFAEAMTAAGFDGEQLFARTQESEIKQKLMENTSAAVERGVFGIPTFFVGDEIFFGKDSLGDVETALKAA